jgi:hypothetical protein
MDAINPTVRTEGGLHFDLAEVTVTAGDSSVPKDFVPYLKWVSMNIIFLSVHVHNLSRSFVAEDHRKPGARVSSFPHMDIGATNPCRLNFYKNLTSLEVW